jgi:ribonuclease BN (tRNA processing enzyme)
VSQPLDLLFLGSGNAFASGRYWSSFLLNGRYLFDASPAVLAHLKRSGTPPADIEAVFISHFHADHFFGIPFLLLEYAELSHRDRDLTIVGPPGIQERVRMLTKIGFPYLLEREQSYEQQYIDLSDGKRGEVDTLRFLARSVTHVEELECFGYRVEVGGRVLAYSGDTVFCESLIELAEGADVFVVECSRWDERNGPHLGPADIRELRRRLGPKPAFVLTHLDNGAPDLGIENVIVAEDFARYSF